MAELKEEPALGCYFYPILHTKCIRDRWPMDLNHHSMMSCVCALLRCVVSFCDLQWIVSLESCCVLVWYMLSYYIVAQLQMIVQAMSLQGSHMVASHTKISLQQSVDHPGVQT